jgi:hypothetical protein
MSTTVPARVLERYVDDFIEKAKIAFVAQKH